MVVTGITLIANTNRKVNGTVTRHLTGSNFSIIIITHRVSTLRGMIRNVGTGNNRTFTIATSITGHSRIFTTISRTIRRCNSFGIVIGGTKITPAAPVSAMAPRSLRGICDVGINNAV